MQDFSLILHIIAGFSALLIGTFVMFMKKGDNRHVLMGRVYFWSMMLVVATSLFLSIVKSNGFLLGVGIFVFYQAFAGMRSGSKKIMPSKWYDIAVLITAFANAIFMVSTGNIVLIVFACITFSLVFNDLKAYYSLYKKKELKKLAWLARHIGMMVGSYIGTFTAFLVVNIQLPANNWIIWIGPTLLFVPLLVFWTRKYAK